MKQRVTVAMAIECDFGLFEQEFPCPDDLIALVTVLIEDLQRNDDELKATLASGDVVTAERAAHSIAGAASLVAADALSGHARRVELSLRNGDTRLACDATAVHDGIGELIESLELWLAERRAQILPGVRPAASSSPRL